MSGVQYIAAIVIYNKECSDSETCKRLERIRREFPLRVLVADNSEIKTNNATYCREKMWEYIPMGGNIGLSKAYNRMIEYVISTNKSEGKTIIVWFDDDTEISSEYFHKLDEAVNENTDEKVFVPIIYGTDGVIYSPNERRFFQNKFIRNDNQVIPQNSFNAINSCMAIELSVFTDYRYDEVLFMDSVDQKFCEDMSARDIRFKKINVKILQHFFQRSEGLTANNAWKRYRIRIHDFMYYANKNTLYRWLGVLKVCAWGLQIGLKCKSPRFFIRCVGLSVRYACLLTLKKQI